jgi:electron transfer flavoprotein alpha subunit
VANIVVFVEVRRGAPTAPSRFAVAEARRVASELGATVYGLLALGPIGEESIAALARAVGEAGADRILCCADASLEGALLDATVGPLLAVIAERLRPVLTLFPAGAVGPALGPPLAVRSGALYHPRASLELRRHESGPRLAIRRFRPDGALRTLDLTEPSRPVVVTVAAGPDPGRLGQPTSEVEMLAYVPPRFYGQSAPAVREVSSEPDEDEPLELASSLVVVGDAKAGELLGAAVPAGTPVVGPGQEKSAALELACPSRLLVVGKAAAPPLIRRAIAPDTRVAVAGAKAAEKDLGRLDVVWRPAAKQGFASLAAALQPDGVPGGEPAR